MKNISDSKGFYSKTDHIVESIKLKIDKRDLMRVELNLLIRLYIDMYKDTVPIHRETERELRLKFV